MRRANDVARADFVALLAADAGADQALLVLASGRSDDGLRPYIFQAAQSEHDRGAPYAQAQRSACDAGFAGCVAAGAAAGSNWRHLRLVRSFACMVFGRVHALVFAIHRSFFPSFGCPLSPPAATGFPPLSLPCPQGLSARASACRRGFGALIPLRSARLPKTRGRFPGSHRSGRPAPGTGRSARSASCPPSSWEPS